MSRAFKTPIRHDQGSTALTLQGEQSYDAVLKRMEFHDGVRERGLSSVGWMPSAYPLGGGPALVTATASALPISGGAIAVPVLLEGHMLLDSVFVSNTDAATARGPVEWGLYEDRQNNSNILSLVAGGALAAFTPTAASLRQILATGAPVYLAPGIYWLVFRNNSTTATFGLGTAAAGTMAQSNAQTKTLGVATALPTTLDFVAATWVKQGFVAGLRLNGRVFGQTTIF